MNTKLLTRVEFRKIVHRRDKNKCVSCGNPATAVHHIIDRKLFKDGGYYEDNGASLCDTCHWMAERSELSCEEIREMGHINNVVLPPGYDIMYSYDKWGNKLE